MTQKTDRARITMPPAEELAVATIHRLTADGYTSSLMKLPRPTLNELGRLLTTAGLTRADVLNWINSEANLGETDKVSQTSFYRFVQRFEEVWKVIWKETGAALLLQELAAGNEVGDGELQELLSNRVMTLLSQEVLTAAPGDLDTGRINAVLGAIQTVNKRSYDSAKLELERSKAAARAEKLAADIDLIRLRLTGIPERIKEVESRLDEAQRSVEAGRKIDRSVFASIREELVAIGLEARRAEEVG